MENAVQAIFKRMDKRGLFFHDQRDCIKVTVFFCFSVLSVALLLIKAQCQDIWISKRKLLTIYLQKWMNQLQQIIFLPVESARLIPEFVFACFSTLKHSLYSNK